MKVAVEITGFDDEGNPTEDVRGEIIDQIAKRLSSSVEREVTSEIVKHFKAIIAEKIESKVTEYLAGSIQLTNRYGEKKGEPRTLIEIIAEEGRDYIQEKVDERGKKPEYSSNKSMPRAQWIVQQMAESLLKEGIKADIDKAKAEAVAVIKSGIADKVREAVGNALK